MERLFIKEMGIIKKLFPKKKRDAVPYSEYKKMRMFLASEIRKRNDQIDKLREENRVLLRSSIKASEKLQILKDRISRKERPGRPGKPGREKK
jgi:hypothetical protein